MRFFSLSREHIPLVATIISVALLVAYYYFKYLPDNRAELVAWKFRSLQNISENILAKVKISEKQLETYFGSSEMSKEPLTETRLAKINAALKNQRSEIFPISDLENSKLTHDEVTEKLDTTSGVLRIQKVARLRGQYFKLKLEHKFDQFVAPLLPKDIFENYIVAHRNIVLHETFHSGLIPGKDTTLTGKKAVTTSGIFIKTIAGNDYYVFVQPLQLTTNDRIYILGLIRVDSFNHSVAKLPSRIILFLITVFTIILILFPIIKIFQLHASDELTLSDALSVCIVCGLMMSMLFLIFVKYSSRFKEQETQPKMLLADEVSRRFIKEMSENYDILKSISSLSFEPAEIKNVIDRCKFIDVFLDRVLWMDTSGTEICNFSKQEAAPIRFLGNFKDRSYFKEIMQGGGYRMKGDKGRFYVEPVVSLITGQFLTDISIPTAVTIGKAKSAVMAISFRLRSIDSLKMLPGYQLALIDRAGKVLYHSRPSRNLNENLIEELSNSRELLSGIANGTSEPFNSKYLGNEYSVQLRAVGEGFPFYVVVLEDISFDSFRDINVFSFTISMQAAVFFIIVLQFLLIFLAAAKRSSIKGKLFDVDWLGPKSPSNKEYLWSICFNICVFATLCVFECPTVLCRIFILLLGVLAVPVFLNLLFVSKYFDEKVPSSWYKSRAGIVGAIPIVVVIVVAYVVLDGTFYRIVDFFSYGILIPGATILLLRSCLVTFSGTDYLNSVIKHVPFNISYTGVLISWMLLSMGLPVLIFFKSAYIYDHHLIARYKHVQLASERVSQFNRSQNTSRHNIEEEITDVYSDGFWLKDAEFISCVQGDSLYNVHPDNVKFNRLLSDLHVYSNKSSQPQINHLGSPKNDGTFFFGSRGRYYGPEVTYMESSVGHFLKLTSQNLNFALPDLCTWSGFWAWAVFIITLIVFSIGFSLLISKLFTVGKSYLLNNKVDGNPQRLTGRHQFFIKADVGINLNRQLTENAQLAEILESAIIVDLKLIPDDFSSKAVDNWNTYLRSRSLERGGCIALINFEYMFSDIHKSKIKLGLIRSLLDDVALKRLIIISAIHPDCILDVVTQSGNEGQASYLASWRNLFSEFDIITIPLSTAAFSSPDEKDGKLGALGAFEHYYMYLSIWQYLTSPEKFFLYDLAEDGLVNAVDKDTMLTLMQKKLVYRSDGRLRLFSPEFKHFIVNQLKEPELELIITQIKDQRNWNRIRIPLSTLALAIVAFVLSSQQEASTKLITSLGALAAVIPTIINFLATLGGISTPRKAG